MKILYLIIIASAVLNSQVIDIEDYQKFLDENTNLEFKELEAMYPAGKFADSINEDFANANYFDNYLNVIEPTKFELSQLERNGFVVTERKSFPHFISAFHYVWTNDLPVYVSSDAILHAWHYSFDKMMGEIEGVYVRDKMRVALKLITDEFHKIDTNGIDTLYRNALMGSDIYLGVATKLLNNPYVTLYKENDSLVSEITFNISFNDDKTYAIPVDYWKEPVEISIFKNSPQVIDFSKFTPNGRYLGSNQLKSYYHSMVWLGLVDIFLTDKYRNPIQEQIIASAIITETIVKSEALYILNEVDNFLEKLIGNQDNINFEKIQKVLTKTNLTSRDLVDKDNLDLFIEALKEEISWNPLYSSNIVLSPKDDPIIRAIPSFKLMGQRPILDGFISNAVTYDEIVHNGNKIFRMNPNTNDIWFALGNNASLQLLEDEITNFPYSQNLAASRYLIDNIEENYWEENLYASWLNTLRKLNTKTEKERIGTPAFMQTAAWGQKMLITQHSGWAELRHDFYLYAKEPYTGYDICLYPNFFVEAIPEFYSELKQTVNIFKNSFESIDNDSLNKRVEIYSNYFDHFNNTLDTLEILAKKELNGEEFTEEEQCFGENLFQGDGRYIFQLCYPSSNKIYKGWYPKLYFDIDIGLEYLHREMAKMLVTSYHTTPADAVGNMVGWVHHIGTGPINLATISTDNHLGEKTVFSGPVFSFYEYRSNDFERKMNTDWTNQFMQNHNLKGNYDLFAYKPNFSKFYLANRNGEAYENSEHFWTGGIVNSVENIDVELDLNVYPNPFKDEVNIILESNSYLPNVDLQIVDLNGNIVFESKLGQFSEGKSIFTWNGISNNGNKIGKGVYFVNIKSENIEKTIKIIKE